MRGAYLYGDFLSEDVAAIRVCDGVVREHARLEDLTGLVSGLSSFGEDDDGEILVVSFGDAQIQRIVPR